MLTKILLTIYRILFITILSLSSTVNAESSNNELETIKIFQNKCMHNDGESCARLAWIYKSTHQNYETAVNLYQRACNLNFGLGCSALAAMYYNGEGVSKNSKIAVRFYKQACDLNEGLSCGALASLYLSGDGVDDIDIKKSMDLRIKSCELDVGVSCGTLATMYYTGNVVARNLKLAADYYHKACELNEGPSCFGLAFMYENGDGVIRDVNTAFSLYSKACDLNVGKSCTRLAYEYFTTNNTNKDQQKKSAQLFQKSCILQDSFGCGFLGLMYYHGEGVIQDLKVSARLLKNSCELDEGSVKGMTCYLTGLIYETGVGIAFDLKTAKQMYQKSCDLNNEQGCSRLHFIAELDKNNVNDAKDELTKYKSRIAQLETELEKVRTFMLNINQNRDIFNLNLEI